MSPRPTTNSSGSEGDAIDERKRKRMLSNRESARRSRMRKQQRLDELIHQVAQLKNENSQLVMQANVVTQQYIRIESENTVLRTQVNELAERLQSLNNLLGAWGDVGALEMGMSEMLDPLLEPWQVLRSAPPVMPPTSMFQC